ncbi:SUMF1/EgtB/PvdO family nonheme iron enzyme [Halopseudomonas pachastrellae]|nr:SUMF1/EgtB/PvdO family nonheme iron enzyme [Halopseudomonas pachastrellae]
MQQALADIPQGSTLATLVTLGLQHEQQHQELMLTDLKHHFACNPLLPAWRAEAPEQQSSASTAQVYAYRRFAGGLCDTGASDAPFSYDNEGPRHRVWLEPFLLGERNVSNGDFIAFINDGGYQRPELWLSDGWDWASQRQAQAPLYWQQDHEQRWHAFTLAGLQPLNLDAAVCHLSLYEADAYARWAGARLPTEAEWNTQRVPHRIFPGCSTRSGSGPTAPICPTPVTSGRGRRGRVQRQIHDQPDGPARQFLCYTGGP